MKIYYDNEADTAYIKLSGKQPDGVIEISDYVNLDTTKEGEITGIEFINASKKIPLETLFVHEIDTELLQKFYKKEDEYNVDTVSDKKKPS